MGCKARTPLDWTHAWAMLGEWLEKLLSQSLKTENGHAMAWHLLATRLHPQNSTFPHLGPTHLRTRSNSGQCRGNPFPILCLPGDKLFQSKDVEKSILPSSSSVCFPWDKVDIGKKLKQWQWQGLLPLAVALIGVDTLPPLWTHPTGSDFVRGSKLVANLT